MSNTIFERMSSVFVVWCLYTLYWFWNLKWHLFWLDLLLYASGRSKSKTISTLMDQVRHKIKHFGKMFVKLRNNKINIFHTFGIINHFRTHLLLQDNILVMKQSLIFWQSIQTFLYLKFAAEHKETNPHSEFGLDLSHQHCLQLPNGTKITEFFHWTGTSGHDYINAKGQRAKYV